MNSKRQCPLFKAEIFVEERCPGCEHYDAATTACLFHIAQMKEVKKNAVTPR